MFPLSNQFISPVNYNAIILFTFSPSFPSSCSSLVQTFITLLISINTSYFNHNKRLLSDLSASSPAVFPHTNPAQTLALDHSSWNTAPVILFPNFESPVAPWSRRRCQLFCPSKLTPIYPKAFHPLLRKRTQCGSILNTDPCFLVTCPPFASTWSLSP